MTSSQRTEKLLVSEEAEGERLDRWLAAAELGLTRSRLQKLITDGQITVDGEVQPARFRLSGGETIVVNVPEPQPTDLVADPDVEFEIVHEDEDLAVIDKPAGLVVHPAPGHRSGTLVHGLLARLDSLSDVGGRGRPGLVHRLDRDTSGLLVIAKNDAAHQSLSEQLRERTLGRVYRAICWGAPDEEQGRIDLPLDRDPRDRKRRSVIQGGRPAITDYRVERAMNGASLLRLRLRTGRTHQIRVHLAHEGHPVFADPLYGGGERRLTGTHPEHRARLRLALGALERQALHAWKLNFAHPKDGSPMAFRSPMPDQLRKCWQIIEEA